MEKTASQKIRLGLFVIIGLLIFIVAVYFIGDKQKMFGKTYHLEAVFSNINGLQLGNSVRYSGINVGTVRGLKMIHDTIIRVDMVIDKAIFPYIKKDAVASISSDGLVGNMIVNILPGKGNEPPVEPGDEIRSQNRIRTEDLLNTLSVTNKNAAEITTNLLKITNEILKGKGTLGLLVNDTVSSKDLGETMRYLKLTTKGTYETAMQLNKLAIALNNDNNVIGVLKDSTVAHQIKNMAANLDQSTNELNKVVTNLDATVLNIKEGKGAINYLSNDPGLVQKIDSTMTNVKEASFKLSENMEALKHNFLFRGYFKKQEKKKAEGAKAAENKK